MKAFVYLGHGEKALQDRPKPTNAAPGDAIVRVIKTTICGTDLHILKGDVATCVPGAFWGTRAWASLTRSAPASPPSSRATTS